MCLCGEGVEEGEACLAPPPPSLLLPPAFPLPGLHIARDRLEQIKAKFPGITYADLYTLAGVVAVEEMGGPTIKWSPGRTDAKVCLAALAFVVGTRRAREPSPPCVSPPPPPTHTYVPHTHKAATPIHSRGFFRGVCVHSSPRTASHPMGACPTLPRAATTSATCSTPRVSTTRRLWPWLAPTPWAGATWTARGSTGTGFPGPLW